MFGQCEDRIGVGEVHDADAGPGPVCRAGPAIPRSTSWRGCVIVVAQKAEVDVEVVDEVGQHPLTHPR